MLHNHRTRHVIVAVAMLAFASGCTNGTTPPQQGTPSETASVAEPTPSPPDETGSASPSEPTESSTSTATATSTATDGLISLSRGDEHKISSPDTTVSITCTDGGDVDIETNGTTARITGDCEDIDVDGDDNRVTGENTDKLDVEGANNTASFVSIREIDVDGSTNVITVEETRDIDVEGDSNTVTYTSGDPTIEVEGDNSVTAP